MTRGRARVYLVYYLFWLAANLLIQQISHGNIPLEAGFTVVYVSGLIAIDRKVGLDRLLERMRRR